VRFWAVFSYLIVYDPAKKPIEIVRVLHGKRDVKEILTSPETPPDVVDRS
jgi:plasmid stabilization system protein ParE